MEIKYKSMYKSELARAAGVDPKTFRSWLKLIEPELERLNIKPTTKMMNPAAVKLICEHFCIELQKH